MARRSALPIWQISTGVAASAESVPADANGSPTRSPGNCRATICWRPSASPSTSLTTPDITVATPGRSCASGGISWPAPMRRRTESRFIRANASGGNARHKALLRTAQVSHAMRIIRSALRGSPYRAYQRRVRRIRELISIKQPLPASPIMPPAEPAALLPRGAACGRPARIFQSSGEALNGIRVGSRPA